MNEIPTEYIATPEPVVEVVSTVPAGRTLTLDRLRGLLHLYAAEVASGAVRVQQIGDVAYLTGWTLSVPQPTDAELDAALPAAQARAQAQSDITEAQDMLDERYRLYNRAVASGNAQAATEIQGEVQEILAYMQEVRSAPDVA